MRSGAGRVAAVDSGQARRVVVVEENYVLWSCPRPRIRRSSARPQFVYGPNPGTVKLVARTVPLPDEHQRIHIPRLPLCGGGHQPCRVALPSLFSQSFRDIEELLAERGVIVSYETIRQWSRKFGASYGSRLVPLAKDAPPSIVTTVG